MTRQQVLYLMNRVREEFQEGKLVAWQYRIKMEGLIDKLEEFGDDEE